LALGHPSNPAGPPHSLHSHQRPPPHPHPPQPRKAAECVAEQPRTPAPRPSELCYHRTHAPRPRPGLMLCPAVLGSSLALAAAATAPPAAAGRLNVLFIVSDDLRPEMGCYGGKAITPHLDKFAASAGAVLFERSYVQQAICCPTRSSFLTGRRPDTTKVWDLHTHFRVSGGRGWTTLPGLFTKKGYFTAGMGKVCRVFLPVHSFRRHSIPVPIVPTLSESHAANRVFLNRYFIQSKIPPRVNPTMWATRGLRPTSARGRRRLSLWRCAGTSAATAPPTPPATRPSHTAAPRTAPSSSTGWRCSRCSAPPITASPTANQWAANHTTPPPHTH
jgi:hypothetical protein